MRGKDGGKALARGVERITPAYAGKRQLRELRELCDGDHPRICGEKSWP